MAGQGKIRNLFERARAAHQAGQTAEAAALYAKVLSLAPRHPDALSLLGVLKAQAGDNAGAETLLRRAIAADPGEASHHNNLGNVLLNLGKVDEARTCYLRSLDLRPEDAKTLNNLGTVLKRQGRTEEAERAYRVSLRIAPDYAEAWANLGNLLQDRNQVEAAVDCQRHALSLKPDYVIALNNLGTALRRLGRYGEAILALRRALDLAPRYGEAASNLAECLKEQGEAAEALGYYRRAVAAAPTESRVHTNLLLALNGVPGLSREEVFAEHRRWAERHADPLTPAMPAFANPRDPDRRLRIGYLSPDFRRHSCAYFIEPILEHHDRKAVEVTCYASLPPDGADKVTERLHDWSDRWRDVARMADEAVARLVREDGIDILVDLAGHTMGSRLRVLAHRPAPVQASYLGYPNSPGMKGVDARLVDAWTDPPGLTDAYATEELIRLPGGFLCYRPPVDGPEARREPGPLTFGSFNNLAKVTPGVIALWAEVLNAVPGSRLFLKAKALADEDTRRKVTTKFAAQGIAPDRLDLMGWILDGSPLAAYGRIDIGLDPFPYNGTTTTCEALWMGVPVVTLAGDRHAGRVGISLLRRVGLSDLAAETPADYVAKAVALAADADRRNALRRDLRAMMAGLTDGAAFTRNLEAAYRDLWRKWCSSPP